MRSWPGFLSFGTPSRGLQAVLACLIAVCATTVELQGANDDDLSFLSSILQNPDISTPTRTNAAVRLLRLGGPGAQSLLAESLQSGDSNQIEAVTRALSKNGPPSQVVAEALVASFKDARPGHGALAGRTLAQLGDSAVESIMVIARNPEASEHARIVAIDALGCFQSRAAVVALLELLVSSAFPEERAESMRSLREITRLDLGQQPERWRSWWEAAGAMPLEQAIGVAATDRGQQIEAQRQEIAELETLQATLSGRLQLVLEQWFITVVEDERSPQLRVMLTDELAPVRLFAANQVQRMLRNGVSPDDQTIQAVTVLLDDRERSLRVLGAQLLAAMRVEGFPKRLALEIAEEVDSHVASVMLDQIALRPSPEAFEPTLIRLEDPVASGAATRALARMVDSNMVPADWAERSLERIRKLHAESVTPATASLLVLAGKDQDLMIALADLDNDLAGVRRASAYAFVVRGRHEPVISRANDEGIRPAAIKALGVVAPTIENLKKLQDLDPGTSELPLWLDSLRQLAVRFPSARRIEVDEVLEGDPRIPRQLRADLLNAAMSSDLEGANGDAQIPLLDRYTLLLALDNRWQEVATTLGSQDLELDEVLNQRLFVARMRLEDFEGAQVVENSPEAWLRYLGGSIESAPAGAATIITEIRERFDDRLTQEQRARLDVISQQVTLVDGSAIDSDDG
jgi:hypothetical protein